MKTTQILTTTLFAMALACSQYASAAITGISGSNVNAYFGSQNDTFRLSNPVAGAYGLVPGGPYPLTASALTNVPTTNLPSTVPSNVTPFSPAPSSSSFFDVPGNMANSSIFGFVGGTGDYTDDAQLALAMNLTQVGTQYAYEQLDFSIDYAIANTTSTSAFMNVGLIDSFVNRSFSVSGNVGSWVQFGGRLYFWDVSGGVPTSIGSVGFSYFNGTPGPFGTTVTGSGLVGTAGPYYAPDSLRVTGSFYVAGDPSDIHVLSLPEPSSFVLAALGVIGLLFIARRQRRLAARTAC